MKKSRKKNKKKSYIKVVAIIVVLIAFLFVGISNYYLNKIDFADGDAEYSNGTKNSKTLYDDNGVLNMLITGSDSRAGFIDGNTDTIIILSINQNNKEIIMTSIMRDLNVAIPGHGTNKINSAVPYGGHTLLMKTIYDNFTIDVEKYVAIDFYSFIAIVDEIGGVEIDVKSNEIEECNDRMGFINRIEGADANDGFIKTSGLQLLTGKQALAYSRIRHVGNADYERTSRQRIVLTAIINKVTSLNFMQMLGLIDTILPEISTNLSKSEIMILLTEMTQLKSYSIIENRIPIEGESVHTTDFSKDIEEFNKLVYK